MILHVSLTLSAILLAPAGSQPVGSSESFAKGETALDKRDYDAAVLHLTEAVEADPTDREAWLLLGKTYLEQADQLPVETQEEWDRVEALYGRGEAAFRSAIDHADEGEADGRAWGALGEALLRQGNATEAIATFYHALQFRENDLVLHRNLANALMMARSYAVEIENWGEADSHLAEAERVVSKALELAAVQTDLLRVMGDVRNAQNNLEQAMSHYRQAITLRPDDVQLHNSYIDLLRRSKEFDQGLDFYDGLVDEAALAKWYHAETRQLKGNFAYQKEKDYKLAEKEYAAAEKDLRASAKHNSEYKKAANARIPYLRSYRGYALIEDGRLDEAEAAFFSALDREPDLQHARAGLKSLMDAHWARIGGEEAPPEKFDELRAFAARVCMVTPDDADAWNNYGFFSREAKQYEESYQAYRRAIRLAPDNPAFLNDTALILLYHLERDFDLAEEWLQDAMDIADLERAEANSQARLDRLTEVYGDAMTNMILLHWKQHRDDEAGALFRRLEEELPDRWENKMWRKRLFPEEAKALEEAEKEEKAKKDAEKKDAEKKDKDGEGDKADENGGDKKEG